VIKTASTYRPSLATLVASSVWQQGVGGCIFADAPSVAILAAAIIRRTNMRRSTTPRPITRLSQVSSQVSAGFTTTVPVNSLPVQLFPLLTLIRWTNRCPDQPDEYPQTGKRCSTNKSTKIGFNALCGDARAAGELDCRDPPLVKAHCRNA